MPTYERTHCAGCHILLGKNEMHDITREVSVLRSGSSVGVRQNGRRRGGLLWSWNSGRKYYANKTIWLCDGCYRQYERTQAIKYGLALLVILIFVGFVYFGRDSQPASSQQTSQATSAAPDAQNSANVSSSSTEGTALDQTPLATGSSGALSAQNIGNSVVANALAPASPAAKPDAVLPEIGASAGPNQGGPANAEATNVPQVGAESDVGPSIETRGDVQYPIEALRSGEEGEVVVDVAVGASGGVENVTVVKSSGYRPLDSAAVESVRRWRFSPGRRNGQPIEGDVRVPIKFSLSGMQ